MEETIDRVKVCELLSVLNKEKPSKSDQIISVITSNLEETEKLNIGSVDFTTQEKEEAFTSLKKENVLDLYLISNSFLLNKLKTSLTSSDDALNVLSLQQNKTIRESLHEFITIGIRFNLIPDLPQHVKPIEEYSNEEKSLTTDYNRLCYTTQCLVNLLSCEGLRSVIFFAGFDAILNALYQILYAPLKKPGLSSGENVITDLQYAGFKWDQEKFKKYFRKCESIIPKKILVKETLLLLKCDRIWFKKAASNNLTNILYADGGLELIITVLLEETRDYDAIDTTKSWKTIDLITKLVVGMGSLRVMMMRICDQLFELVSTKKKSEDDSFESSSYRLIFASCTKAFYSVNRDNCKDWLLWPLCKPLIQMLIGDNQKFENTDITNTIQNTMGLLRLLYANNSVDAPDLPIKELFEITAIFYLYAQLSSTVNDSNDSTKSTSKDMEVLLLKFLQDVKIQEYKFLLDNLIFNKRINSEGFQLYAVRDDIAVKWIKNRILISTTDRKTDPISQSQAFFRLLKSPESNIKVELKITFFTCLLNLLELEEFTVTKKMLLFKMLTSMAEDTSLQIGIRDHPEEFLDYVVTRLTRTMDRGVHCSAECETPDFRTTFLLITILQALANKHWRSTKLLLLLNMMRTECVNEELSAMLTSVIDVLEGRAEGGIASLGTSPNSNGARCMNELDKAVADVCDPLLPVRAGGLNAIAKLVEDKHPDVLGRKMFILNIFHQNIQNEDSFIYLPAIKGLATMADMFPDTVLEILTEEYTGMDQSLSGSSTTSLENRMKLGEVLIKVSRNLADRAPKYKGLLLNTFMSGAKDEDHLMRASSLSNLGEICQVLGYKLGSIVNEVLKCVHDVIMTDPAVEARRAAVTVIRALFVGLGVETLAFLKDDIDVVYHTLREIYDKDEDKVMRLQAQVAIEELVDNIRLKLNLPSLEY